MKRKRQKASDNFILHGMNRWSTSQGSKQKIDHFRFNGQSGSPTAKKVCPNKSAFSRSKSNRSALAKCVKKHKKKASSKIRKKKKTSKVKLNNFLLPPNHFKRRPSQYKKQHMRKQLMMVRQIKSSPSKPVCCCLLSSSRMLEASESQGCLRIELLYSLLGSRAGKE